MSFFNVVVPTYNSERTLERAICSIRQQTFKDFHLVLVDDISTDKTPAIILSEFRQNPTTTTGIFLREKRFNGGARNEGVLVKPAQYLVFLDSDDEIDSPDTLNDLHRHIVENDYPDLVRLPFLQITEDGKQKTERHFYEKNVGDVRKSRIIACWTKCVKYDKFIPFPENTLAEDAVQHLKQADSVETVSWFDKVVARNYIRKDSTSHANSLKWQSSQWRMLADFMDLELRTPEAKLKQQERISAIKKNLVCDIL